MKISTLVCIEALFKGQSGENVKKQEIVLSPVYFDRKIAIITIGSNCSAEYRGQAGD